MLVWVESGDMVVLTARRGIKPPNVESILLDCTLLRCTTDTPTETSPAGYVKGILEDLSVLV